MLERLIVWSIFGVGLSLTPLIVVAAMGWLPASGPGTFLRLLCNEDFLAVALTLGGAAAADVLIHSAEPWRRAKIFVGGITFLNTIVCVAGFVIIKAHVNHLDPSENVLFVANAGLTTLSAATISELLAEV